MYELIIVGGGPGGVAAGIYAARKKIKTLLITETFGGQSIDSSDIHNWIGTKSISGFDFAKMLEDHLRAQDGTIEIIDGEKISNVLKLAEGYHLATESGKSFETKYLLTTAGSHRKRLDIPGGKEFDGRGVVYCSICDAPLFGGKAVAVVGGGNSAVEAVIDLLAYASKIYLIHRRDTLRADPVSQERIKADPKVEFIWNAEVQEILGNEDKFVNKLRYKDKATGEVKELKVDGVFVEIGSDPNTNFLKELVKVDASGHIVVDHRTQQTSEPGIWAAGDATDVLYKQNNISAGDAIKAVLNIYDKLTNQNREQPRD